MFGACRRAGKVTGVKSYGTDAATHLYYPALLGAFVSMGRVLCAWIDA